MKTVSRACVTVAAGLALVSISGCGPGGLAGEEQPLNQPLEAGKSGLASVNPCSMLKPDDLSKFGFEAPGEPENQVEAEPGCTYMGETYTATVFKNQTESVESYKTSNDWGEFNQTQINGRTAANAIGAGATDADTCTTMFNAGDGVALATVTSYGREPIDPCGESTKVAEAIEPDLPNSTR